MARRGNVGFEIPAKMRAHAGAKRVGELSIRFAERNIASSFEFGPTAGAREGLRRGRGAACRLCETSGGRLSDQAKELTKEAAKMARPATQH